VHKQLGESDQKRVEKRWEPYLEGRPHQVCFKIPTRETKDHLLTIGRELDRLETEVDEVQKPIGVICPEGCRVQMTPGQAEERFIIRFEAEQCRACPFFKGKYRVLDRARSGPTIYLNQRVVELAGKRKQLHPEDTPLRVVVESTIRSVNRAFPGSKLPVRGLIRSRMMLYSAALMVNLRRLHEYLNKEDRKNAKIKEFSLSFFKIDLIRCWKHVFSHFWVAFPTFRLQPATIPLC